MAYATRPTITSFVDERTTSTSISGEEHSFTGGTPTYSLAEVPDTSKAITAVGVVHGSYTVSFTETAPSSGTVYVDPKNGNVTHNVADAPDTVTWAYWGRGTANNAAMLGQWEDPLGESYEVARQFWMAETSPLSTSITIGKGNADVLDCLVQYGGETRDISSDVSAFGNNNYYKLLRICINGSGVIVVTESAEAAAAASCVNPPGYAGAKTIGYIYVQENAGSIANIENSDIKNTFVSGSSKGDTPNPDPPNKVKYSGTVVSGDSVCYAAADTVKRSDANDDTAMPAFAFVTQIIDATYCFIQTGGIIDLSTKDANNAPMSGEGSYYVDTSAGGITATKNEIAGEWDQRVGYAMSATKLDIHFWKATKNRKGGPDPDPDPDPDPSKGYSCGVSVTVGEYVYISATDKNTAIEARADSSTTCPAAGIVTKKPDTTHCIVANHFHWVIADYGGAYPGIDNGTGNAGDDFGLSPTNAGQKNNTPGSVLDPDYLNQVVCTQTNAGGTEWYIHCESASGPEPVDPGDGYDYDCVGVAAGDSVYLDASSVAHKTDISDDSKVNAKGIVKAINGGATRCNIVCPPNIYDLDTNYTAGEYFLLTTPGVWGLHPDPWAVDDWKVRIGYGRGANLGGVQVDIKNYGKFGDPGSSDGSDNDPKPARAVGHYRALTNIAAGYCVERRDAALLNDEAGEGNWSTSAEPLGIALSSEHLTVLGYWEWTVLTHGLLGAAKVYTPGAIYYIGASMGPTKNLALGKYMKPIGIGTADGDLFVDPGLVAFILGDTGDPVSDGPFVSLLEPMPFPSPFEKIRDNDGSILPITGDYMSDEFISELPTIFASVDFFAKSTGAGAAAYLECDLLDVTNGIASSLLTTKAHITAQGDGTRGDTLPASAHSSNHQRAVLDATKFPLAPGSTVVWSFTRVGGYTTAPYGIGVIINKYSMKL